MKTMLLNTAQTKEITPLICEFENQFYIGDFQYNLADFSRWIASDLFVYNAITTEDKRQVLATCGFLITNRLSYERCLAGEINECEMLPLTEGNEGYIYYSSVIAQKPEFSREIIRSTFAELLDLVKEKQVRVKEIFTLPCTKEGVAHALKNHFHPSSYLYEHAYPVYIFDQQGKHKYMWDSLIKHSDESVA